MRFPHTIPGVPRLGELLVETGVLGEAQLDEGLRSQVIHGARLGTNLVELGYLELDGLANALARMHALPPALRRHFESCDSEVQERLPSWLAATHKVVPIGFLADDENRVMVACRDPLRDTARRELEVAMGLGRGALVPSICGELRLLYFLERVYQIPRATRFLRVRRGTTARGAITADPYGDDWDRTTTEADRGPFAATSPTPAPGAPPPAPFDEDATTASHWPFEASFASFAPGDDFQVDETPIEHILEPPPPGTTRRPRRTPSELPEPPPVEVEPPHVPSPLGGEELRRFVETLADPPAPALGRIAIRRVAVSPGSGELVDAADVASVVAATSIVDVARMIRRARSRNRVGELALAALRRFGGGIEAAILFVVRENVAFGWKGFAIDGDDLVLDELAIPLEAPTILSAAAEEGRALLIDGAHGTEVDRRLWAALGRPVPGQAAVAPVLLVGHPVALLYGQAPDLMPHAELFASVTAAITSAFARLLRAAQR